MSRSYRSRSVGVLISVYISDTLLFFKRAIESILNQSSLEGVCVRIYLGIDGPIDHDVEKYINDSRGLFYKIYKSDSNVGLACILNHLLSIRENESLFFRMDADDFSFPERFSEQIAFMDAHTNVDILGTAIIEVHETFERVVRYPDSKADFKNQLCKGTVVAHPTVCFRASLFDRVGLYPDVRGNEDIAYWFKCISFGVSIDNLDKPLLRFTISSSFWKRRSYKKAFSEFLVYVNGCYSLHGFTYLYFFAFARLLLRLSPVFVSKFAYSFRHLLR
jgi:hypothetical protein